MNTPATPAEVGRWLEGRLTVLCREHYVRFRKIPTSVAIPSGWGCYLEAAARDRGAFMAAERVVLYGDWGLVSAVELPLAVPEVLSDKVPEQFPRAGQLGQGFA